MTYSQMQIPAKAAKTKPIVWKVESERAEAAPLPLGALPAPPELPC